MPAENIGPAARRTTQCTELSAAAARRASPVASIELVVEGVALVRSVEHDVTDRAVRFSGHEGHCASVAGVEPAGMSPRTPIGHDLLERLGSLEAVDAPRPEARQGRPRPQAPEGRSTRRCPDTWLGHPVHPLLILVPMGTWTSARAARLARRPRRRAGRRHPARRRPRERGPDRRHAGYARLGRHRAGERRRAPHRRSPTPALNGTAAVLFGRRRCRSRGRRSRPRQAVRAAGLGAVGAGGYLGGHRTHARGRRRRRHARSRSYPDGRGPGARRRGLGEARDERRIASSATPGWRATSPSAARSGATGDRARPRRARRVPGRLRPAQPRPHGGES